MDIMRDAGIVSVMLLAASGAAAQQRVSADALPPAALKAWEADTMAACRKEGGRFGKVRFSRLKAGESVGDKFQDGKLINGLGIFIPGEFNGDGKPDYILVAESPCAYFPPADLPGYYGRLGGPTHEFVLSTHDGYAVVEGAFASQYTEAGSVKQRSDGRSVVEVDYGSTGRCGYVDKDVWAWTGRKMDIIERRNEKGQLVDQEGCLLRKTPTPVGKKPAAAAKPGRLPIKDGLWADTSKGGCKRLGERAGQEDPAFIIDQTSADEQMFFSQEAAELKPVKELGNDRYLAGRLPPSSSMGQQVIRVLSPTSIVIERGSAPGTYVWCSPATRWQPWVWDPSEG